MLSPLHSFILERILNPFKIACSSKTISIFTELQTTFFKVQKLPSNTERMQIQCRTLQTSIIIVSSNNCYAQKTHPLLSILPNVNRFSESIPSKQAPVQSPCYAFCAICLLRRTLEIAFCRKRPPTKKIDSNHKTYAVSELLFHQVTLWNFIRF